MYFSLTGLLKGFFPSTPRNNGNKAIINTRQAILTSSEPLSLLYSESLESNFSVLRSLNVTCTSVSETQTDLLSLFVWSVCCFEKKIVLLYSVSIIFRNGSEEEYQQDLMRNLRHKVKEILRNYTYTWNLTSQSTGLCSSYSQVCPVHRRCSLNIAK